MTKKERDAIRIRKNKLFSIEYLGGECKFCRYKTSLWALEFHHKDPEVKDENFKNLFKWSKERIMDELDKCMLLCANCHREEHERIYLVTKKP